MNNLVVKNVELFGDTVVAAQDMDGNIWAGIKWICDGLGLSEGQGKNERKKLQEDLVLSEGTKFHPLGRGNGNKEVLCLRHDFVPLWIAKITVTPAMKENNPELVDKLVKYQLQAKDVLAEAFLPKKKEKPGKSQKKNLSATNMLVKTVSGIFKDAGVNPVYIAAEAKRLYKEQAGVDIDIPLITDNTFPTLWDCTSIAKELGILSESGRPHEKAVSAIIQKLDIFADEVLRTAYSRNGHDGVTVQYKGSVLEKVREWLDENCYPTVIEMLLSNGNVNKCKVVYREVA